MEPLFGYFAAGIASILVVLWNRRRLKILSYQALRWIWNTWKYLLYKQIVRRHRYLGPWTAAGILLHVIYFSANGVGVLYSPLSGSALTTRSGVAALINISFLACSPNIDFLSEIFGVTPKTWRKLHWAVAWMVGALVTLHFICALSQHSFLQLARTSRIGSILGSTIILTIPSASVIKWLAQERPDSSFALIGALASKFHLPFGIAAIAATYVHVIVEIGISWQIFVVPGCFFVILLRDIWCFLYRNGMLSGQFLTQVSMAILSNETIQINVYPGRPVHIYPGQYIMLWVPAMTSWWHFKLEQHHVQSWAFTAQHQLKLFRSTKPRPTTLKNWELYHETPLQRAFFTGPYGLRHNFLQYETILIVVHDYGLLSLYAQIQYIYQCIEDRTSRTRRIHLVWQWDPRPRSSYPQEIKVHKRKINQELDVFSKKVCLDRAIIEYHLGIYSPSSGKSKRQKRETDAEKETDAEEETDTEKETDAEKEAEKKTKKETETARLERLVKEHVLDQETDSDAVKRQKHDLRQKVDRLFKEIGESDKRVNEFVSQFYDDVRLWMNAKLKRSIDNFSQEYTVYDTNQKTDSTSGRAKVKPGLIPLRNLFQDEVADHRERILKSPPETRGKFLLMISGPPSVQELAHELVIENLRDVDLKEFQYKPGQRF